MRWLIFLPLVCLFVSCGNDSPTVSSDDQEEVNATLNAYINALEKRDSQAVANFWGEESIYKNPTTGELVQGRDQMVEQFKMIFSKFEGADFSVDVSEITFPIEDKAVAKGMARLTRPKAEPVESEYQMILMKKGGQWYVQHVSQLDLGVLKNTTKELKKEPATP